MKKTIKNSLTTAKLCSTYKKLSLFRNDYEMPLDNNDCSTKQEILLASTVLFSLKGYHNVSIRDIADTIGIKTSSIYNHFKNKDELWEKVLLHAMKLYLLYMRAVDKQLKRKNKIKDMLSIVFYEPKRMKNIFPAYAFGVIQRERVYNEFAGKLFDIIGNHTAKIMTRNFKRCSDINSDINPDLLGLMIMFSISFGLNSKTRELQNRPTDLNFFEFYGGIQKLLLSGVHA